MGDLNPDTLSPTTRPLLIAGWTLLGHLFHWTPIAAASWIIFWAMILLVGPDCREGRSCGWCCTDAEQKHFLLMLRGVGNISLQSASPHHAPSTEMPSPCLVVGALNLVSFESAGLSASRQHVPLRLKMCILSTPLPTSLMK